MSKTMIGSGKEDESTSDESVLPDPIRSDALSCV